MTARGSYAKGRAKREEILATALDVVEREGIRGASVRELAHAVGLSQTGLLHYFESKDELFTEILRKRDELAESRGPHGAGLEAIIEDVRASATVPGLVQLYAQLSVESALEGHAAHEFFAERYQRIFSGLVHMLAEGRAAGTVPAALDPEHGARIIIALIDGLQIQWLHNPDLDMAAHLERLWDLVAGDA